MARGCPFCLAARERWSIDVVVHHMITLNTSSCQCVKGTVLRSTTPGFYYEMKILSGLEVAHVKLIIRGSGRIPYIISKIRLKELEVPKL